MESEVLKRLSREQWQEILDGIATEVGMMTTLVDPHGRILIHRGHHKKYVNGSGAMIEPFPLSAGRPFRSCSGRPSDQEDL